MDKLDLALQSFKACINNMSQEEMSEIVERIDTLENTFSKVWSELKPPSCEFYYPHFSMNTPLGELVITCQEYTHPENYDTFLNSAFIGTSYWLEDSKEIAIQWLESKREELIDFLK